MKVSLNWLKEYIDLSDITVEELAEQINLHVCEIESIKPLSTVNNLVVGHVLTCVPHPDSDHLHICEVNLGSETKVIVCGAPNIAAGQNVIVALPGAILPGGTIKVSKVRGVESNGMICSLQELGIEDRLVDEVYKAGIYVLPSDAMPGTDVTKYLGLDDIIIDLDLTSNRSDLLSIEGVAYDIAAALGKEIKLPDYKVKETKRINPVKIKIEDDSCYEYNARLVEGVTVKESPMWLKMRLIASGIRPINNVVDITNYVMVCLGTPMHAYDFDVVGANIVVKKALEGSHYVTLDNIDRELKDTDLLITDGKKPLGLAGVMGGLDSEIEPTTKNLLLEAAMFEPLTIRKTSQRLGLKSEASTRFERIAPQIRIANCLNLSAKLLCELAGGTVIGGINREVVKPYTPKYVDLTLARVNSFLGSSLDNKELEAIFKRLNYQYEVKGDTYHIEIPARRMDLEDFFADICEDIARMIGYDKIPTTISEINNLGGLTYEQNKVKNIRKHLASLGLNETVSYSLVSEAELNLYNVEEANPIKVLMPLTSDRSHMRVSLLNGIMSSISYNLARQNDNISIFEIGKRYSLDKEELMLAAGFTGSFNSSIWQGINHKADFYLVKGILDNLASILNVSFTYKKYDNIKDTYHPGMSASIYVDDMYIGFIAGLHPEFRLKHDLKETYVFELNLDKLLTKTKEITYKVTSKYPSIERDLAIIVDNNVSADEVLDVVKMVAKKYLVSVNIFDLYKDESLGENKKSLAFKMVFNDVNKTLDSKDVDKTISSILNRLDFYFKATLR